MMIHLYFMNVFANIYQHLIVINATILVMKQIMLKKKYVNICLVVLDMQFQTHYINTFITMLN